MYGLSGERQLLEWEVQWLPGYQGAKPVRIGNAAAGQLQLDVYGELMDAIYQSRRHGLASAESACPQQHRLIEHLERIWEQPDEGIWEVRGGRRHFTFSKIMAWVALDRTVRDAERYKLAAPLERWRQLRDHIHATICERGFDGSRNTFTQSFGSSELDASLLLMPTMGFLPPDDPRVRGTLAAVEKELLVDGFVLRYRTKTGVDGLPPGEGVFLLASGLPIITLSRTGTPKQPVCSSACYRSATTSAYSRKNTIPMRGGRSEISRRRSRTSLSSEPL
jgi:GH15 family glucan-1,4-alpha-glucosidase